MYVVQEPAFLYRDRVRNIPTYLPTSTSPSPFAFQEPHAQYLSPISQLFTTGLWQNLGFTSKPSLDHSSSDPTFSSKRRGSSTATALDDDVDVNMRPDRDMDLDMDSEEVLGWRTSLIGDVEKTFGVVGNKKTKTKKRDRGERC